MKINKSKILLGVGVALTGVAILSCSKDFIERPPVGSFDNSTLANKAGVEGLLVASYSMLDGFGVNDWMLSEWHTSVWNNWAGSLAADEAHKGGAPGQQNERAQLENKTYTGNNDILKARYRFYYAAITRTNETIRLLDKVTDGTITEAEATQIRAEARFLRGVFHLEAAKMWNNVPYVDETISVENDNFKVPNSPDPANPTVWANIEADFQFAIDNLTPTKAQVGRANSWAAKAFLAKTYMQQAKLAEALPILTDVINNGITSAGTAYDLMPEYQQNFSPDSENGPESVFSVQMAVNDGAEAQGRNGNWGEKFQYPPYFGEGVAGWGYQMSFDAVNTFKTQAGLPLLDTYNQVDVKNNFTIPNPSTPFTPETNPLDPRLDWTVGRRGIPHHDWGVMNYPPDPNNGPYWGKKWTTFKGTNNKQQVDGWQMASGINYPMMRFADVLLLAAEAEVEVGSLGNALTYVNRVRTRAANPAGFLKTYLDDADPQGGFSNTAAANYVVNTYPSFADKEFARKAVRFERRLELATEGHRFFDLQRYDRIDKKFGNGNNYMANRLNTYIQEENAKFLGYTGNPYAVLNGAVFVAGKHEVYAIPQEEIDRNKPTPTEPSVLTQNPQHN